MESNSTVVTPLAPFYSSKSYRYGRYVVFFSEAFVIVVANLLTLIAVQRSKKLRDIPANTFIVSLACADAMSGLLMPATTLTSFTPNQQVWLASSCVFRGPYYSMFCISLATLLAIGVDRYMAVVHPLAYGMRMTTKIARIASLLIWLVQLTLWQTFTCYYGSRVNVSQYRPVAAHDMFPKNAYFFLIQIVILMPVISNVFLYAFIYIRLRKKNAAVSASARNNGDAAANENQPSTKAKAFTKMMTLVLSYLTIAWLPYYIFVPIHKVNDPTTPVWYAYTFDAVAFLFYSNSFMNPLIYSWQNRDFREAYAKIFRCSVAFGRTTTSEGSSSSRTRTTASSVL